MHQHVRLLVQSNGLAKSIYTLFLLQKLLLELQLISRSLTSIFVDIDFLFIRVLITVSPLTTPILSASSPTSPIAPVSSITSITPISIASPSPSSSVASRPIALLSRFQVPSSDGNFNGPIFIYSFLDPFLKSVLMYFNVPSLFNILTHEYVDNILILGFFEFSYFFVEELLVLRLEYNPYFSISLTCLIKSLKLLLN